MDKAKWTSLCRRRNFLALVLGFGLLYGLMSSGFISMQYQGIIITIGIYVLLAASLNLTTGVLGELVLGHAGFMSIGAYTAALFTLHMDLPALVEFPLALLLGGALAAVFGVLIGIPALRLRGDYLAIVTLGFGEIIRVVIQNLSFTGGGRGLYGIDEYTTFPWVFWIAALSVAVMYAMIGTRQGRAILSLRENEIAAEAVGVPGTRYKVLAFTISSFFAGVAGGLYAHYITVLDPATFDFNMSIEILVMVVLGGMGSFTGSVLAAVVLTLLPELLRDLADYRMLIYSVVLVLMMILRPQGLLGKREFSLSRLWERLTAMLKKPVPAGGKGGGINGRTTAESRTSGHQFPGPAGTGRCEFFHSPGGSHGADRPQWRRQDHPLQPAHRCLYPHRRHCHAGRRSHQRQGNALYGAPWHQPYLPEYPSVQGYDSAGQCQGCHA